MLFRSGREEGEGGREREREGGRGRERQGEGRRVRGRRGMEGKGAGDSESMASWSNICLSLI